MSPLIIYTSWRTGGTQLAETIANHYHLNMIYEPDIWPNGHQIPYSDYYRNILASIGFTVPDTIPQESLEYMKQFLKGLLTDKKDFICKLTCLTHVAPLLELNYPSLILLCNFQCQYDSIINKHIVNPAGIDNTFPALSADLNLFEHIDHSSFDSDSKIIMKVWIFNAYYAYLYKDNIPVFVNRGLSRNTDLVMYIQNLFGEDKTFKDDLKYVGRKGFWRSDVENSDAYLHSGTYCEVSGWLNNLLHNEYPSLLTYF